MKHDTTKASATTELCVSLFIIAALAVGIALVANDVLTIGKMIIGVVAVFGSFGPDYRNFCPARKPHTDLCKR